MLLALSLLAAMGPPQPGLAISSAPVSTAFLGIASLDGPLASAIGNALVGNGSVALQAPDVTASFLETAHGLGINCDPALDECLLQLAAVCTVQQAAYAVVDGAGPTRRLALRLAVVEGGVVRSVTVVVNDRPDLQIVEVREAVAQLVAPLAVASVVVDAEAGSVISLDGLERATAPMTAPLGGLAPGQHFVDVRFPNGNTSPKPLLLSAGRRTRVIALPRPVGADVMVDSGWAVLGTGAIATGIASFFGGEYIVARVQLEDFSTHYATDRDYNDHQSRTDAVAAQDHLTDLPTYSYPLFGVAVVCGIVGGGLLYVGARWSDLFDPPAEESVQ